MSWPSGENAAHQTSLSWPLQTLFGASVTRSQNRMVWSELAVKIVLPSGDNSASQKFRTVAENTRGRELSSKFLSDISPPQPAESPSCPWGDKCRDNAEY